MRCYFLKKGHITAVEVLKQDDDPGLIGQSRKLFAELGPPNGLDGFEIWDGSRFVFRFPPHPKTP
jgi:hypothetical protein